MAFTLESRESNKIGIDGRKADEDETFLKV
jgi:hypothetical protein